MRLFNLIKELSGKHEITLICEKRDNQSGDDITEVEKICKKVITVNRKKQWTFENIIKSILSKNSFLIIGHTNPDMRAKIEEELKDNKFDLIHVETFYVMQNLPDLFYPPLSRSARRRTQTSSSVPIVLAEHNIEYQVYQKYADSKNLLLKSLLSFDIAKIRREEERSWEKVDRLIAVSEKDKKVMREKGLKPVLVSNGVDTKKFSFNPSTQSARSGNKKVLFIGDFKWIQNRDAAKFIIQDIWPLINRHSGKLETRASRISNEGYVSDLGQAPIESGSRQVGARMTKGLELKLWIVGRKIPKSIKSLTSDPDVLFDEKSSGKSTEELFQEADVLLAPIRVGGGTSYKILEAMSCGTPVVTTGLSANAIGADDGKNIMVGKTAEELAEKTVSILSDKKLYDVIAKNGRKLIEDKYTWKEIAKDLEEVYKSVK